MNKIKGYIKKINPMNKVKKPKKVSLIKELLKSPDDFEYTVKVINGEIQLNIKKVEEAE